MNAAHIAAALERLSALASACKPLAPQLDRIAARYAEVLRGGGTLFFCGNGGSAADAQHLAAEYVVRYTANRRALAAIALSTDSSVLTAAGNDLGFEQIFARQVDALCRPGDLLSLHSTSGRSPNVIAAARAARLRGAATVAFVGQGAAPLAAEVDEALTVPSMETSQVQVMQLALQHIVVELVESALLGRE